MTDTITIVRGKLPTPDAVIVRRPDGSITIVADHSLPEQYIEQLVEEAPTLRDPTHAVG